MQSSINQHFFENCFQHFKNYQKCQKKILTFTTNLLDIYDNDYFNINVVTVTTQQIIPFRKHDKHERFRRNVQKNLLDFNSKEELTQPEENL